MRLATLSLFALALGALPASAEVIELEEILVSANLTPVARGRSGTTVVVVEADELRAAGETRLVDFLDRVAGINIRTQGPLGTRSGFALRGASQNYVKVTLDGIDMSDPSGPQVAADIGALTVGGAGRIEVVKGAQSAIHGANAMGGLIAITSRRPEVDGTQQYVETEAGSFGTLGLTWGLTHRSARTEAAVSLSHLRTDGFSAAAGGTEADGFRTTRLHFHIAHKLDNGVRIGASGFAGRERSEYDPQFYRPEAAGVRIPATAAPWGASPVVPDVALGDGQTPDEVARITTLGLRAFVEWRTGAFTHSVALAGRHLRRSYSDSEVGVDYTSFDPVTGTLLTQQVVNTNTYIGQRLALSYLGTGAVSDTLRASFGAEMSRETYRQSGTFGPGNGAIRMGGVFGELQWSPSDRLDLSAALRHDQHSDFGGSTTGRVALAYRLADDLILRAQAGTGYRAPSSYERFGAFVGNPALAPEKSRSLDIGVEKRLGNGGSLRATAFVLEAENLIDYDFTQGKFAQVPGVSRRKGLELEADVPLTDRVRISANYTYLDSAANTAGSWARQPRHSLGLNLGVQATERLQAGVQLRHVAKRPTQPDYTVVNLTARYDIGAGAEAWLRLENVFDTKYQIVPGYGTPGRSLFVGLRKVF